MKRVQFTRKLRDKFTVRHAPVGDCFLMGYFIVARQTLCFHRVALNVESIFLLLQFVPHLIYAQILLLHVRVLQRQFTRQKLFAALKLKIVHAHSLCAFHKRCVKISRTKALLVYL